MLTKEKVVELLRENYPYLVAEFDVDRIGLFGSYAKGIADEGSDIDIVVEFNRPIGFRFVELAEYLEHLLGTNIDVLTPTGIRHIRVSHIAQDITESVVYV